VSERERVCVCVCVGARERECVCVRVGIGLPFPFSFTLFTLSFIFSPNHRTTSSVKQYLVLILWRRTELCGPSQPQQPKAGQLCQPCRNRCVCFRIAHTHTHTHIYIYIYIYILSHTLPHICNTHTHTYIAHHKQSESQSHARAFTPAHIHEPDSHPPSFDHRISTLCIAIAL
jgi:hypothetical protein